MPHPRTLPRSLKHLTPAGLLLMDCVAGPSMKVIPDIRKAALPFPAATLRRWHDQWLAAVALRIGTLSYLDEPLVTTPSTMNKWWVTVGAGQPPSHPPPLESSPTAVAVGVGRGRRDSFVATPLDPRILTWRHRSGPL